MPRNSTVSIRSQRSISIVPRRGQGRSHQAVEIDAVEVVWVDEAVGLDARYGVCMGGVSIVCGMGLKRRVIEGRRRRCQGDGSRSTDSGGGCSGRLGMSVLEGCLAWQGIAVIGLTMAVVMAVVMAVIEPVPVLVLLPKRVVVLLMGAMVMVSQWTSWGRRGSRMAGGRRRTKAAVLLFMIAGVHSGGGQDNVTATIND